MFKLLRTLLLILFLASTTTQAYSEGNWIKIKKKISFCVQKSKKSSFGYAVTKLNDKSICKGKDFVVTEETNSNLYSFLLTKHKSTSGVFFVKESLLSKYKVTNNKIKLAKNKEKKNKWINEKKDKNKEELKKKITESKSWISKKSKDKKKKLKKYRNIDGLPEAELYFAAKIEPSEKQEAIYLYGYINSDKKSDKSNKFKFNNIFYFSLNDGIAFFDDGKTTCQADMKKGVLFDILKGKIIITCNNRKVMGANNIDFNENGKYGKGSGEYKDGSNVKFKFSTSKDEIIAKLNSFKDEKPTIIARQLPISPSNKNIKLQPNGKYYALLIGNSIYDYKPRWIDLVSPKNDIEKIKAVLDKSYKFEKIITVFDGTKKEILDGFIELSKLSTDNDYVLIYYAGHGEIKHEKAYWIPKDGTEWINDDWIDIDYLDALIREEISAHHLAVLVDSCYVGSKFKGLNLLDNMTEEDLKKNYKKQLTVDLNKRARAVLSSGSVGQVSDTVGGTGNSLFALTLINFLKAYEKSSIPVNLKNVAWNMDQYFVGTKQRPHYYNPATWADGGGDFIFIPKSNIQ